MLIVTAGNNKEKLLAAKHLLENIWCIVKQIHYYDLFSILTCTIESCHSWKFNHAPCCISSFTILHVHECHSFSTLEQKDYSYYTCLQLTNQIAALQVSTITYTTLGTTRKTLITGFYYHLTHSSHDCCLEFHVHVSYHFSEKANSSHWWIKRGSISIKWV